MSGSAAISPGSTKGRLANLTSAYQQLLQYKDALDNPPLLVVSDMERFVIRTNFTNTPARRIEFTIDDLVDERNLAVLRAVFFDPDRLKPEKTTQRITEDAAERITQIATSLRDRGVDAQEVARFLDRVVFCLFAEDVGLLPDSLFSRLVAKAHGDPKVFGRLLGSLFEAMAHGGEYGVETIRHFNGHLFADASVVMLAGEELDRIHLVTGLDWSAIDPSIFGTRFERALDPARRSQLGAHYTSRDDIETIVDPVVMAPLLREWDAVRVEVDALVTPGHKKTDAAKADAKIQGFLHRLQHVSVLDPACGSGNFLYVVLQKLKNLEKQVILYAMDRGFSGYLPQVGPWQLHGIELNPYAYELAQMTVWIGWLQWIQSNGFGEPQEPILQELKTFTCRDAILTQHPDGSVTEPEWPAVDFIVSNPPEWVKEDVLEFPASVDGPWARMVTNPNSDGIGTARYVRLVPVDEKAAASLKKRTLTNLYNDRPAWLANAHRALDEAVFAAYGWPPSLTDDEVLEKLLALNLAQSAAVAGGA